MENSNKDRWSLLATDLGIEVGDVKGNDVEGGVNKVASEEVGKEAAVVVVDTAVTNYATTEQPQNTSSTQITPTPTNTRQPDFDENSEQNKKFNLPPAGRLPYNSLGNSAKPVAAKNVCPSCSEIPEAEHASAVSQNDCSKAKPAAHTGFGIKHVIANRSTFGAGILEPDEIDREINVTKNQTKDLLEMKPTESSTNNLETAKSEPAKVSFFGRLQQINFFGSRNKNDNTSQNTDNDNNNNNGIVSNEYSGVSSDVQSEREHLPHGRYLPPHAQSLYKSHTQSTPPAQLSQQNNQYQNQQNKSQVPEKEVPDLLRQIASQIGKLAGNVANNDAQKNNTANQSNNFRYKNSANRVNQNYSNVHENVDNSAASLFDDELKNTDDIKSLEWLIGGSPSEDEEQRRLASLLGEPRGDQQRVEQQPETRVDDEPVSPRPTQPNRVSHYPNNRNRPNNLSTKPNHVGTGGGVGAGSNPNRRWSSPISNSADKSSAVVRGRRGSRFVSGDPRAAGNPNSNGTNRPNTPHNPRPHQPPYQQYQSTANDRVWQSNEGGHSTGTPTGRDPRRDQSWRGRVQPVDPKIVADTSNDPDQYNNPPYPTTPQSQQQQYSDYSAQLSLGLNSEEADYIDDDFEDGIVSEADRLSFAQAHKNIPSWNDAVESIVNTNIQRHSRYSPNQKRR
ncbi:MAG: hypothetical protein LBJ00_00135 [Planctomycetaceae bacterium]|jgi:hypothetical protein|nr:hypothetical protein [Planctomycetaceae bacterium]